MDLAQAFLNANAKAQLAVLPHFSNKTTEEQLTPAPWLQKVISQKEKAKWTDAQTIIHFRNALRGTRACKLVQQFRAPGSEYSLWNNFKTNLKWTSAQPQQILQWSSKLQTLNKLKMNQCWTISAEA